MKIGFDAKRAFCNYRGLGNYSRSLITSLVKFHPEHQYHLFTPKIKPEFEDFLKGEVGVSRHLPSNFLSRKVHPFWRSFQLADEVKEHQIDLYHGLSHEIPNGIQKNKCATVVSIHDLMYIHFPHFFPWIDRYTYDKKIRYAVESSDSIIAICEQTKNDLINYYQVTPERIEVIYQSIGDQYYNESENLELPIPEKIKDGGYILSVGAFVPNKNFETLIKAYALFHEKTSVSLVIAGFGNEQTVKRYMELAKSLGVEKKVYLTQEMRSENLPSLYRQASVFALASFHEGFGIPLIEAMASRCPIVTTGGGAHQEAAGGHGLFFDPNSIEEVAQKILQVLENNKVSEDLIQRGFIHSKNFTSKVVSQNLFEYYEKVSAAYTN